MERARRAHPCPTAAAVLVLVGWGLAAPARAGSGEVGLTLRGQLAPPAGPAALFSQAWELQLALPGAGLTGAWEASAQGLTVSDFRLQGALPPWEAAAGWRHPVPESGDPLRLVPARAGREAGGSLSLAAAGRAGRWRLWSLEPVRAGGSDGALQALEWRAVRDGVTLSVLYLEHRPPAPALPPRRLFSWAARARRPGQPELAWQVVAGEGGQGAGLVRAGTRTPGWELGVDLATASPGLPLPEAERAPLGPGQGGVRGRVVWRPRRGLQLSYRADRHGEETQDRLALTLRPPQPVSLSLAGDWSAGDPELAAEVRRLPGGLTVGLRVRPEPGGVTFRSDLQWEGRGAELRAAWDTRLDIRRWEGRVTGEGDRWAIVVVYKERGDPSARRWGYGAVRVAVSGGAVLGLEAGRWDLRRLDVGWGDAQSPLPLWLSVTLHGAGELAAWPAQAGID